MCFRGGFSRNPDRRSHWHTCTTPTVSRLRWFSNVFGRYFLNRTVEYIPIAVMEGFHSLLVWNHSQRPISRAGAHPLQLGEVFFDKTLAEGPSAAPAPFSLSFSLVIVNVIHFLYQLEVNEVSMDRLFVSIIVTCCSSLCVDRRECNALSPEEPRHYNRATSENNLPNVFPWSILH